MSMVYHATTYENARMILSYDEADIEFGEVNGFAATVVKGQAFKEFEGKVFVSEKPIAIHGENSCYIAIDVSELDITQWQYNDDDEWYGCKNYAIPATVLNTLEFWRCEPG